MWLNVITILAVLGLAAAGWFWLRAQGANPPSSTLVSVATLTPIAPTSLPPTALVPKGSANTPILPTSTPAPTPTAPFTARLTCADADRARHFYDCTVTNDAAISDTFSLSLRAEDNRLNGFNPSAVLDDQGWVRPDAATRQVPLGSFAPGQSRPIRLNLPCTVTTGCPPTTFIFTLFVNQGKTLLPGSVLKVTTHYFPP